MKMFLFCRMKILLAALPFWGPKNWAAKYSLLYSGEQISLKIKHNEPKTALKPWKNINYIWLYKQIPVRFLLDYSQNNFCADTPFVLEVVKKKKTSKNQINLLLGLFFWVFCAAAQPGDANSPCVLCQLRSSSDSGSVSRYSHCQVRVCRECIIYLQRAL